MTDTIKRFVIGFLCTGLFYFLLYFLIKIYDPSGETIVWIHQNIYYIIFLFICIVFGLTIYGNDDKKSKLMISIIFFSNFLYLVFVFGVSNIGLNQNLGLLLVGFLILGLVSNYIKNFFGGVVTTISVIGILTTILFSIIPLYEQGPDIKGFKDNFSSQFLISSNINIDQASAVLEKDKKTYPILNGVYSYRLDIHKSGSLILFKSDKLYPNTFGYLVFKNLEIVQIYPQSAILIHTNGDIEIITGNIKYHPQNPKSFNFTGKLIPSIIVNQDQIDLIENRHQNNLKKYILSNTKEYYQKNKLILNISEFVLKNLSKIIPKYKTNLQNLYEFQKFF